MSRRGRTEHGARSASVPAAGRRGYFERSVQPLHVLVFLLPFLICYELALLGIIGGGDGLEAHRVLVRFFDLFGAAGLHLPSALIVSLFLVQHAVSGERWRIEITVLMRMLLESMILTIPLILIVMIIDPSGGRVLAGIAGDADDLTRPIMLAFGAGLYEEFLFRFIMITIVHFLLADTLQIKNSTSAAIAVILSALAFAMHHDQVRMLDGSLNVRLGLFYVLAGAYFGILFLWRGFGIVVGAHVLYDLLVLIVLDANGEP